MSLCRCSQKVKTICALHAPAPAQPPLGQWSQPEQVAFPDRGLWGHPAAPSSFSLTHKSLSQAAGLSLWHAFGLRPILDKALDVDGSYSPVDSDNLVLQGTSRNIYKCHNAGGGGLAS